MAAIYSKLTEEMGRLNDCSKDLDIFWDGEANTAFISALGRDIADAMIIIMKLRETCRLVTQALEIYLSNEKEVQRMIGTKGIYK